MHNSLLIPSITKPRRITEMSPSTVDLFWTNIIAPIKAGIITDNTTYQYPVFLLTDLCKHHLILIRSLFISMPAATVNTLNDFFSTIGSSLSSKIPSTNAQASDNLAGSFPNTLYLAPPNPTEVSVIIDSLKNKSGQPPMGRAVRGEGILNTSVSYYLPYGILIQDPNPEEECLQAQVEIPRWGTRILTSLYVMEGTENLEDEVFLKRHTKPEQDEKRRKRWDLQRMREQRHYERLRERYEGRQNPCEPEVSGYHSLWPNPESAVYLHVDDCLPVCAFGQPMARIPPQEFVLPWLSSRCQDGVSTRRRKRP
nr:uncharacterized protein LOC128685574 [Cherax quadricarinatus]